MTPHRSGLSALPSFTIMKCCMIYECPLSESRSAAPVLSVKGRSGPFTLLTTCQTGWAESVNSLRPRTRMAALLELTFA